MKSTLRPNRVKDLVDQRFGKLRVIAQAPGRTIHGKVQWICVCDCGKELTVDGNALRRQKSCGCSRLKHGHARHRNGQKRSRAFMAWTNMLQRCNNANLPNFSYYGGRGVTVCDRWDPSKGGSFQNFLDDMGEPAEGLSLDKDKNANGQLIYSPETCCWLDASEQSFYQRRVSR